MRLPLLALTWAVFALGLAVPALADDGQHALPGSGPAAAAPSAVAESSTPKVETGSLQGGETATAVTTPSPHADIGKAVRGLLAAEEAQPGETAPAAPDTAIAGAAPPPPSPEEADRLALKDFYAARGDEPLWVTKTGLTPKALSAIRELQRAGDWALDPAAYEVPSVAEARDGAPELSHDVLAKADMTLSLSVLTYARHARGGLIPEPSKQLSSFMDRKAQYRDRKALLEELAGATDAGSVLTGLHPKHQQFDRLRQAWLEAKRTGKSKAVKVPAGPDLVPGERHPHVALLRKRMGQEIEAGADETLYDERLAAAVKGFQSLKGLSPADGLVTPSVRSELAKPYKANAEQLGANLQQWRWMPEDLGDFHVWVNVPEYLIRIVKGGEIIWTERITAGLVSKQTPIFDDQMERVTFKSRWRVPDSIKVREVWPSLLHGGGMMRQHGLIMQNLEGQEVDWRRIDWSRVSMKDYTLWQPPGPKNQLGLVKFSFPSKHYVFMHDTPDKYMFNWSRRANSHGCMRIRNPLKMAEIILNEINGGWDSARVQDAVKNGPDHDIVELNRKVPVHITYFTARVGETGKIETWSDIYGHEKRIKLALAGQWDRIDVPPDHLAPLDQESVPRVAAAPGQKRATGKKTASDDFMSSFFGGF